MMIRTFVLILCLAFPCYAQKFLSEDFGHGSDTSSALDPHWQLLYARGIQGFKATRVLDAGSPCARVEIPGGDPSIHSLCRQLDPVDASNVREVLVSLRYKTNRVVPILVSLTHKPICVPPFTRVNMDMQADEQWHQAEWKMNVSDYPLKTMWFELIFETTGGPGSYVMFDDIQVAVLKSKAQAELTRPSNFTILDNAMDQKVAVSVKAVDKTQAGEYRFTLAEVHDKENLSLDERKVQVRDSGSAQFDLLRRQNGVYHVSVYDPAGNSIGSWRIRKTEPRANEVTIRNGVPCVNGKPYMILGLYHSSDMAITRINEDNRNGLGDFQLDRKDVLAQLRNHGFNTVFYTWNAPPLDYLEDARALDLMVICETRKDVNAISPIKDHPSVLAWYGIDEPSAVNVHESRQLYNDYRVADPYHPVMAAIISTHWMGMRGSRFVDIAAVDDYPIRTEKNPNVSMKNFVASSRPNFSTNVPEACTIVVPQLFGIDSIAEPTYQQLRASVYSAITGGAKGFLYYAYYTAETLTPGMAKNPKRKYWFLPESSLWDQVGGLNQELLSLEEAILTGTDLDGVAVQPDKLIDFRYLQARSGRYLILVNPTAQEIKDVQIVGLVDPGTNLFQSSPIRQMTGSTWSVDLKPYDVVLYQLKAQ